MAHSIISCIYSSIYFLLPSPKLYGSKRFSMIIYQIEVRQRIILILSGWAQCQANYIYIAFVNTLKGAVAVKKSKTSQSYTLQYTFPTCQGILFWKIVTTGVCILVPQHKICFNLPWRRMKTLGATVQSRWSFVGSCVKFQMTWRGQGCGQLRNPPQAEILQTWNPVHRLAKL